MTAMMPIPVEDPLAMAWLDCNDLGNAERFVRLARGLLRWVEREGRWIAFDGRRWSMADGDHMARQKAHEVAVHVEQEALALNALCTDAAALASQFGAWCTPDIAEERVIALRKHALKSGNAAQTGAMLTQAHDKLRITLDQFDTDPLAYNVLNGTLRFVEQAGGWSVRFDAGHDPEDRISRLADVVYDADAGCPNFLARLNLIQPDAEQRDILPMLYGMTLTGLVSDQAFYVHQGKGGDGKSSTHGIIAEIHGDYFSHAAISTFLEGPRKGGSEHRSDLVRLQGDIRMVLCDEPKKGDVWNGSVVKQITGGKITARGFHKPTDDTFQPRWKLFVECNPLPRAPSDDDGFRRRMKLYVWPFQFTKSPMGVEPIDVVERRLRAEKSGILNWMIGGALRWLETRHIPEPAVMTEALANYWAASSPMAEWMEDWCDLTNRQALEPAGGLYGHFKGWCEGNGIERPISQTAFGRALTERHIMAIKDRKGNKMRRGIRLRADWEVEAAAEAASPAPPSQEASPFGVEPNDVGFDPEEFEDGL